MRTEHLEQLESDLGQFRQNLEMLDDYISTVEPVLAPPDYSSFDATHLKAASAVIGSIVGTLSDESAAGPTELDQLGIVERQFDGTRLTSISFRAHEPSTQAAITQILLRSIRSIKKVSHL